MIIKEVEYKNFRQFKEHGSIKCSSNGKITLIYGKNGDGKTTLHQLFHWIFYNTVNFNKTTTDKLYNLFYEKTLRYNDTTETEGKIYFEHNGEDYVIRRIWHYQKQISKISKIGEEVDIFKQNENGDWKKVTSSNKEVSKIMEEILPSGLSEYFFFDGESMIADLKVKSSQSANKLKEALYKMFDLSFLDLGINHIGNTDKANTVIGKLYSNRESSDNPIQAAHAKENMLNAEQKIEFIKSNKENDIREKQKKLDRIKSISETIGSVRSTKDYEATRKKLRLAIDKRNQDIEAEKLSFGQDVYKIYPKLLLKKRFEYAKKAIKDKIETNGKSIPLGLEKELIETLLSHSDRCICGTPIGKEQRKNLEKYIYLFPPYSYSNLYNRLETMFNRIGINGDEDEILNKHFKLIMDSKDIIDEKQRMIDELDEEQKKNEKIQHLVEERIELEHEIDSLQERITKLDKDLGTIETIYKQEKKKFDKFTSDSVANKIIDEKIKIMELVKKMLENELTSTSQKYSELLKFNIEYLLENMLTSKRRVEVNSDFHVRVFDSFNDESKSEGQFAVVSFAYIGAILKLMKEEEALKNKEYPLVLDGPFSKLDEDQRQNVIDVIPEFAPQIILFSKDSLQDYIKEEHIGNIWTIMSNEEKNISYFEEGYQWD